MQTPGFIVSRRAATDGHKFSVNLVRISVSKFNCDIVVGTNQTEILRQQICLDPVEQSGFILLV